MIDCCTAVPVVARNQVGDATDTVGHHGAIREAILFFERVAAVVRLVFHRYFRLLRHHEVTSLLGTLPFVMHIATYFEEDAVQARSALTVKRIGKLTPDQWHA